MTIDYDWYCFIDDDTFINTNNLNEYLKKIDSNKTLYIGRLCLNYSTPFYMSGGAGFILSKKTYVDLLQYIKNTDKIDLLQSIYGDLLVGLWITKIKDVEYINNDNFNPTIHNKSSDLNEFISFHYLKTFEEFEFYYNLIK